MAGWKEKLVVNQKIDFGRSDMKDSFLNMVPCQLGDEKYVV